MELLITSGLLFAGYNLAHNDPKHAQGASFNNPLDSYLIPTHNVKNIPTLDNLHKKQKIPGSQTNKTQPENTADDNTFKAGPYTNISQCAPASSTYATRNGEFPGVRNHAFFPPNTPETTHTSVPFPPQPLISSYESSTLDSFNYIDDTVTPTTTTADGRSCHKHTYLRGGGAGGPAHNNMTPFYSGALKQNLIDGGTVPLLDFYTHADDAFRNKRDEIPNMFTPNPNTGNVYGDITLLNNRDNVKQRFAPSLFQQGVTSVQAQKVGPGLNLGPSDVARPGWQEMLRVMPPTTNEIRTLNKPKETFAGRVLPGKAINSARGLSSAALVTRTKKAPTVENTRGERNFKTTGAYFKAQMPRNYLTKENNRDAKMQLVGPAFSGAEFRLSRRDLKSHQSRRQNYLNNYLAPLASTVPQQMDCVKDTFRARATFRQEYASNNYISNLIASVAKSIVRPNQNMKETRKQATINSHRLGNAAHRSTQPTVPVTDTARCTTRQQTNAKPAPLLGAAAHQNTRTQVFDPTSTARNTLKHETLSEQPAANPFPGTYSAAVYDPESRARPTTKHDTLAEYKHSNLSAQNVGGRGTVYDPSADSLKPTLKQTLLQEQPVTNISAGTHGGPIYDPDDLFRTTLKETNIAEAALTNAHVPTAHVAFDIDDQCNALRTTTKQQIIAEAPHTNVANISRGNQVYNPHDLPKTTLKQSTLGPQPLTNVNAHRLGVAHDPCETARPTLRQTTLGAASHANVAGQKKPVAFDYAEVPRTTVKETALHTQPLGNLVAGAGAASSAVYDPSQVAKTTLRQQTLAEQPLSNLQTSSSHAAGAVYDPSNTARETTRQTTDAEAPLSNIHTSTTMVSVYDPTDRARSTIKESVISAQPLANAQTSTSASAVYNPLSVARETVKETTLCEQPISNTQASVASVPVYDPCDVARHTVKETTLLENYAGQISAAELRDGGYKNLKIKPRYTSRQDIEADPQNNYYGAASSTNTLASSALMYKNMTTNAHREKILLGREPTQTGAKSAVSLDDYGAATTRKVSEQSTEKLLRPTLMQEFEFFKMSQRQMSQAATGTVPAANTAIFSEETRTKNVLEQDTPVETYVLDSLQHNPYSISLHKA